MEWNTAKLQVGALQDYEEVLGLVLQLEQMRLQRLAMRVPPADYLCHLCFQKGHYIKDCPQVHSEFWCIHRVTALDVISFHIYAS